MRNHVDLRYLLALGAVVLWGCPIDDARFAPTGGTTSSSGGDASSSSSSNSSSSSGGGAGGHGGGAAGMGGVMVSSSSGMGGAGGTGGAPVCPPAGSMDSCGKPGCPDCPKLVMIGTGTNGGKTSTFSSGSGWSTVDPVASAKSDDPPAFAIMNGKANGVAVWRSNVAAELNRVKYAGWNGTNGFATFGDVDSAASTRATPAIAASSSAIHVGYLEAAGNDRYFYAQYDGSSFLVKNELAGGSLGKCSPALASIGANDVAMVNPGWDNDNFYDVSRKGSNWGTANPHTFGVDKVTPAIVALTSTPKLLVVMTKAAGQFLHSVSYDGVMWAMQTLLISGAVSTEPVLLALPSGEALLVYRKVSTNELYWSRFNGTLWSGTLPVGMNVTAQSRPVLALGAGDAEAELLFIDSAGNAQHARLRKGESNFDPPVVINGASGLVGIAAATNL